MKIAIVACFFVDHRLEYIIQAMKEEGHDVQVLTSNFSHITKKKVEEKNKEYIYIDVKEYKKNMSFQRIYSHYEFAKKIYNELKKIKPDLIYATLPPNFLAKYIIKYKKEKQNIKVIFDIIDMWPETLPMGKVKKMLALPLKIWSNLRDKNLKKANYVVTECDLYQNRLKNKLPQNTKTIHLVGKYIGYENDIDNEIIQLSYLGSINNIIDIDLIINMLKELKQYKNLKLHIIGDGEKREQFIQRLEQNEIPYKYYGKVFDDEIKAKIFNKCQFGINVMKTSTCVGLSVKSIDYFKFGLPIINNIKEDTTKIVEKYNVGFNVNENNLQEITKEISEMKNEDFMQLKKNVCNMYKKEFEIDILKNKITDIMEELK